MYSDQNIGGFFMKKKTLLGFLTLTITVPLLFGCKKTDHTSVAPVTEIPTPNVAVEATQSKDFSTDYLLTIDNMTGYDISDLLYGLFLEDINSAVDGGLYAEMVKNRSFEYGSMAKGEHFHGWSADEGLEYNIIDGSLDYSYLNQNNTHFLRIRNATESELSIKNSGFLDGMTITKGAAYEFSGYFRSEEGSSSIQILLKDESGNIYASATIPTLTKEFHKYDVVLTALAGAPSSSGVSLCVVFGKGNIDADMISLFPQDTYKGRKNGLKKDLALTLEDLSPAFLRFPGGCVVEGETLENAYCWKDSIGNGIPFEINGTVTYGDVATRPLAENLWGDQNLASNHPYYMTYGLGFYEYFLLCEDLGSEPIPILNAGLSCLIQGARKVGTPADALPVDSEEFYQYIQDALDLVEFCKGDETTTWGAIRIAMGHVEPFPLNYIGIGNEQWGSVYFERYEQFVKAFEKAAIEKPELYKDIQLIVANGPTSADTYAWKKIKRYGTEYAGLVDEHYYMTPSWFLSNTKRYDSYDRNSVPVFLGEYAAKSNNLEAALAEAAFMTGIERNGDIVKLASYAPLFGNSVSYQWTPDLIWFKSGVVWKSVNYYVQQLFSTNVAKQVIPSTMIGNQSIQNRLTGKIGVGTWKTIATFDELMVTSNDTNEVLFLENFDSSNHLQGETIAGDFHIENGKLKQSNSSNPKNAITGDVIYFGKENWSNYTLTLKATKLSGEEGFLIPIAVNDSNNFYHWNIGGFQNTVSCLEMTSGGSKSGQIAGTVRNLSIKENQEYELKIVVSDTYIQCYLDNTLMISYEIPVNKALYQVCGVDENQDIILKLVNTSEKPIDLTIRIPDLKETNALVTTLTSESLTDMNTVVNQTFIVPKDTTIIASEDFIFHIPKYSVSILRIPTK